jgi:hypothetical protein
LYAMGILSIWRNNLNTIVKLPRKTIVALLRRHVHTRRKTVIYDYVCDCNFSHLGQVLAYMTSAPHSHCGPVIPDNQSYGTLK